MDSYSKTGLSLVCIKGCLGQGALLSPAESRTAWPPHKGPSYHGFNSEGGTTFLQTTNPPPQEGVCSPDVHKLSTTSLLSIAVIQLRRG